MASKSEDVEYSDEQVYGMVIVNYLARVYGKERKSSYRGIRNLLTHAYDSPSFQMHLHQINTFEPTSKAAIIIEHTTEKKLPRFIPETEDEEVWLLCSHMTVVADYLKEVCFVLSSDKRSDLWRCIERIWRRFRTESFPKRGRNTIWWTKFIECESSEVLILWKKINEEKKKKQSSTSGYHNRITHFFESLRHGTMHFSGSSFSTLTTELETGDSLSNELMVVMVYLALFKEPLIIMLEEMISLLATHNQTPLYYQRIAKEEMGLVRHYREHLLPITRNRTEEEVIGSIKELLPGERLEIEGIAFCQAQKLDQVPIKHTKMEMRLGETAKEERWATLRR